MTIREIFTSVLGTIIDIFHSIIDTDIRDLFGILVLIVAAVVWTIVVVYFFNRLSNRFQVWVDKINPFTPDDESSLLMHLLLFLPSIFFALTPLLVIVLPGIFIWLLPLFLYGHFAGLN
jgi:cobalamin synthase